ncbi:hypothetical protein HUG20_14755 [Salicibibacter cibi]|uniref:Uncharacterized protein n=1 Tax=Salicibibacter cibi TaxID=2743001 RepID=A0A7T6ZCK5_9BACI|nr:hypothetical protein [Salicibibacter cibi]QQK81030.1 hypothetical protein HUG20_14755 [Salicibibacter cibi]
MSDFMKEVVGQILSPERVKSSNDGGENAMFQQKKESSSVDAIQRPNYQLQNKNKRLSTTSNERSSSVSKKTHEPNVTVIPNNNTSNVLSKLQTMSLTNGERVNVYNQGSNGLGHAKMIGESKAGGAAWFFSKPSESLKTFFYRDPQGSSVGSVNFPNCYPSQLVYVNNVIRDNQTIKFYMEWDKDNNGEFLLELFYEDEHWLKSVMNQLFQKLNRNTMKRYDVFNIDYPSTWLSKQLGIIDTVEGLCFIEGLPYYSNVALLDYLLKAVPNTTINYSIENEYLLVAGNQADVKEAEAVFRKNGGQFIG